MVQGTRVGFIAIVIFGTIALLTTLTQGVIPPFQMMAMCFSIAFILIFLRWIINKENGAGFDWNYLTGYLCALGAAISWGLYSTLSRLVRNVPLMLWAGFALLRRF